MQQSLLEVPCPINSQYVTTRSFNPCSDQVAHVGYHTLLVKTFVRRDNLIAFNVVFVYFYILGATDPTTLNPRLICPWFDIFCPWLPEKAKIRLRFGVRHEEVRYFFSFSIRLAFNFISLLHNLAENDSLIIVMSFLDRLGKLQSLFVLIKYPQWSL